MVQAEVDSFKLALQGLAKDMLHSHKSQSLRSQQPETRTVSPVVSCCIGHSDGSWWHSSGCYCWRIIPELCEAASEAERRPKKHAEEQEIDQLDLDHAEQGILVDFHTHTQKPHNIGHRGRDDACSKVGGKSNNLQLRFTLQIKGAQHSRLFYVSTPAACPFEYLY